MVVSVLPSGRGEEPDRQKGEREREMGVGRHLTALGLTKINYKVQRSRDSVFIIFCILEILLSTTRRVLAADRARLSQFTVRTVRM